jgi:hypothetical protein
VEPGWLVHFASKVPEHELPVIPDITSPRPPCTMKITVSAVIIRTEAATISASVWDMPLLFIAFAWFWLYKNGAVNEVKRK